MEFQPKLKPPPLLCNAAPKNPRRHDKWGIVTHSVLLFTLSTMETWTMDGPFKGTFVSIICCALFLHQLTAVMSCGLKKPRHTWDSLFSHDFGSQFEALLIYIEPVPKFGMTPPLPNCCKRCFLKCLLKFSLSNMHIVNTLKYASKE